MAWQSSERVELNRDDVDEWDEYDSTPYGGGYDLALTYGRPLAPSDAICYPLSSSSGSGVDYNRPNYSLGAVHNAYTPTETDSDFGDRYGARHNRPKPQSEYGSGGSGFENPGYGKPQSEYGPGYGKPQSEYGNPGYRRPQSEYGSEYNRPQAEHGSEYGNPGYGNPGYGNPGYGNPQSEYGSGYRPHAEVYPPPSQGSGYGRTEEYEKPKPYGYGGSQEGYGGAGYGVQPSYGNRPKDGDDGYSSGSDEEKKQRRKDQKHRHKEKYQYRQEL